ncbi:hypothetical protein RvY_01876 [Ramazzottius varieornatus]|uniref:Uncharacterized protein n=2 Tax=Ramazzottius varieornatus TaxID=947166 RepID=A0A1D1UL99_RAMVA|nr:hypothetical protein RvY_01876 [Ramazzottius varieornatus]
MDKLDLIILKEIKAHNPYSVSTHKSKKIWETIFERSNELITVHKLKVGSRNERNIKDRLKKLIRVRTAKVNKIINTTGGSATDPLSEAEHLIVGIINDQNKSKERSQAEEEKEEAEADEVKSIQQKALLIMKRKRTDDEDIFEGVEDWKADEERELDVGINRDNRQAEEEDGADASNKDEGNTDGKNHGKADGAQKKKTIAQIEPGKKRLRVNATERMMDNKMKVDREIKDAELRTKLVIAKMEIAEREKDREIRRKEQEMQENKIKLEHEFNMRKLELEMQLELEKLRKSSLENNTVSALLQLLPKNNSVNYPQSFDY